jgi:LPXTG-motif cell wall-anchored protein
MLKTRLAAAAGLAAVVTLFTASAASAYPDPVIEPTGGSAADGVVAPGEDFTLTGNFSGTDCNPWSSTFNGEAGESGTGTTFSVTFTAPEEEGDYSVDITCVYDDGTEEPTLSGAADNSSSNATQVAYLPSVIQTATVSFPIEVRAADSGTGSDDSDSDNGALPDTGGTSVWYLVGGAALVAGGAGLVVARRRTS